MQIICVDPNRQELSKLQQHVRQLIPDAEIHGSHIPAEGIALAREHGCDVLLTEIGLNNVQVDGFVFAHLNYLLEFFVVALGVTFLLGTAFGIIGVWAAFPVTEALTCLVNLCLARKNCGHFPRKPEDLGFYGGGPFASAKSGQYLPENSER